MTTSRASLLRQLAAEIFPDKYTEFNALGTSTDTVVQGAELRDGAASENSLSPGWFYIYDGTGQGSERGVTAYAPRASSSYGTVTVARPLTATPDTSSACLSYSGGLAPAHLIRHINEALRRARRQRKLALTLVTDGLMESSTTASWTASSATLAKVTTASIVGEGKRALSVTNSGVNGYAAAAAVAAIPGEQLRVEATGRVSNTTGTHTATLVAYDDTNAAEITAEATASRFPAKLGFEFAVPAGCYSVSLRLRGSAADTVAYWDEVLLWRVGSKQIALPTDVTRFDDVFDVYQRAPQQTVPGETTTYSGDYDLRRLGGWRVLADPEGANQFVLDVGRSGWTTSYPLVVDGLLPWPELATDDDLTGADQDEVLLRAKALCYAQLARVAPREDRQFYRQQADLLGKTWATAAARQPRPPRPIRAPVSRGAARVRLGGYIR